MKALIWKELRENLKWAVLALLLVGGIKALLGPPSLMDYEFLQFISLVAAVFGAVLGFLQVFFESHGDRRAIPAARGDRQRRHGYRLAGRGHPPAP